MRIGSIDDHKEKLIKQKCKSHVMNFDSGVEELETQNSVEVKRWRKL